MSGYRPPAELYRLRWQFWVDQDAPDARVRARASFGRYVAAKGGALTPSSGPEAYAAWSRVKHRAGFHNRRHRRHLASLPDYCQPAGEP